VKLFASYREALGKDEVDVDVEDGSDVSSLIEVIKKNCPELGKLTETVIVSINREYADYNTILKNGDEVALLPPVSGG
jgi:molybdopterin synthase catalytic subunit